MGIPVWKWKKAVAVGLCAVVFAGCGKRGGVGGNPKEANGSSAHGGPYEEEITIDVFDDLANFQGEQAGWFAKIVQDKFHMKLNIIAPNIAGGRDTLYQTRTAAGNLGDLIITGTDGGRLKDLVSAGLLLDMTPYLEGCDMLNKNQAAIAQVAKLAGKEGVWAVPSEISNQPATEPCDATEPTNAPSLRWDIYGQVGYPKMETLEDLLMVLSDMQHAAGKSESGKAVYAISLFRDWDSNIMQNASGFCALYGYEAQGFVMAKGDGSDMQSVIDTDGIYVRALQFLFDANQQGLVDPESLEQDLDALAVKYQDGAVLYSIWPWLGAGEYNTYKHTSEGKGFATAVIGDMKCLTYGSMPNGKCSSSIMVGSQTQDPQRLVDFIDWLYSPEGIRASCSSSASFCGPQGLTWEMDGAGKPKLTDFGVRALVRQEEGLTVPEEWGTGTWKDGVSALNYKAVGLADVDESNGVCYNYQRWEDYHKQTETKLSKKWSAQHGNALTALEYLKGNDMLIVNPGTDYAAPEYETDIQTIMEQCRDSIIASSWKMVFARNQEEFDALLKDMQDTVNGLGYQRVFEADLKNIEEYFAAKMDGSGK